MLFYWVTGMWDRQLQGFMAKKELADLDTSKPELGTQQSVVVGLARDRAGRPDGTCRSSLIFPATRSETLRLHLGCALHDRL